MRHLCPQGKAGRTGLQIVGYFCCSVVWHDWSDLAAAAVVFVRHFVAQSLSCVWLFATPRTIACQASLSFTISQNLLKLKRIDDAIQPSHPLLPTSPTAFCLSRHQRLFQWIGSSHHLAKFLELQLLASVLPMNIRGWFPLGLTYLISLQSKRLSRIFSNTTVQQHQFFSTQPSLWSNSHIRTWLLEKP